MQQVWWSIFSQKASINWTWMKNKSSLKFTMILHYSLWTSTIAMAQSTIQFKRPKQIQYAFHSLLETSFIMQVSIFIMQNKIDHSRISVLPKILYYFFVIKLDVLALRFFTFMGKLAKNIHIQTINAFFPLIQLKRLFYFN